MRVCLECGAQTDGLFCPTDGMATIIAGRQPTSTQLQPQTIFANRYRIVGTLGRGGMGAVYDALHTGTGQRVAIKTLLIDVAHEPQAVKRFFYEAKLTASLQHPNTIRVFDFGQSDDGIFFLVMERLQGETLGERLQRYAAEGRMMSESEAASIGVGVLRSLGEAHRVGLVHRDLKPGNIFLHDIGGGETVVKVLDFGIAKHGESNLTQSGTSLGTPSYMSPEQVMGQAIDGRSDLYSLGIVLYQCVSGKVPFPGESSYTVMMKQVHDPVPDLAELGGTSKGFAFIVRQAMAKKVDERFATAQALREALEPVARGEVVQAPGAIEDKPTQALATGQL
ncbi:MAG: serine/threonine protein kinase, partial [Deltaproteobacteria bacterium]|nr:serine/threonine protein kinase [Deltaproteobacteria bacterium]